MLYRNEKRMLDEYINDSISEMSKELEKADGTGFITVKTLDLKLWLKRMKYIKGILKTWEKTRNETMP